MDPAALKKMVSAGTASVAAYEAYLEGLALAGKSGVDGSIEDWHLALQEYERATDIDPTFALAYFYQSVILAR